MSRSRVLLTRKNDLATPHSGSSLATYGNALATITQYIPPFSPPRVLLDTLRRDSRALSELAADFVTKASELQIASFYETKMTKIGPIKMMVDAPNTFWRV